MSGRGAGDKRSRLRDKAIEALLTFPTLAAAAKYAGVGEYTLRRWLREPAFDAAYRQARQESLRLAIGRLSQVATCAVSTLVRVMADKTSPQAAKVTAAKAILDTALRASEVDDLKEQVAQLEARLEAITRHNGANVHRFSRS